MNNNARAMKGPAPAIPTNAFSIGRFRESIAGFDDAQSAASDISLVAMFDNIMLNYKVQMEDKKRTENAMLQMALKFKQ